MTSIWTQKNIWKWSTILQTFLHFFETFVNFQIEIYFVLHVVVVYCCFSYKEKAFLFKICSKLFSSLVLKCCIFRPTNWCIAPHLLVKICFVRFFSVYSSFCYIWGKKVKNEAKTKKKWKTACYKHLSTAKLWPTSLKNW